MIVVQLPPASFRVVASLDKALYNDYGFGQAANELGISQRINSKNLKMENS